MRAWIGLAVAGSLGVAGLACATLLLTPAPAVPSAQAHVGTPLSRATTAMFAPAPLPTPPSAAPEVGAARAVVETQREAPSLDQAEALQLMQWMAERGDPRSPELGGLKPRQGATAAELADPRQYAALEDRQTRELLQAYAGGVKQIPEIRARIEVAEQSGERNASELDEARAALAQLETMKVRIEIEAPQLLPGDTSPPPAKP